MAKKTLMVLAAAAALLFVLSGCLNTDLPPIFLITDVTVTADSAPVDGYVYLDREANTSKTLTADVEVLAELEGDGGTRYTWSIVSGGDFVTLSDTRGKEVSVAAEEEGTARIRLLASNGAGSKSKDFNVVVNPAGILWTFEISSGQTEIFDRLFIPPEGSRIVSLKPVGSMAGTPSYSWAINGEPDILNDPASPSDASSAISVMSGVREGTTEVSITVTAGTESLIRTFGVKVGTEPTADVLLNWSSASYPIEGNWIGIWPEDRPGNTHGDINRPTAYTGYGDVVFRSRNMWAGATGHGFGILMPESGGIKVASMFYQPNNGYQPVYLVIGSTVDFPTGYAETSSGWHVPGLFDLSSGAYRLTIDYSSPVYGGAGWMMRICVNNNSASYNGSVLGGNSLLREYGNAAQITGGNGVGNERVSERAEPGRIILEFTSPGAFQGANVNYLKAAFISIVCNSRSSLTVTGIRLERIEL